MFARGYDGCQNHQLPHSEWFQIDKDALSKAPMMGPYTSQVIPHDYPNKIAIIQHPNIKKDNIP